MTKRTVSCSDPTFPGRLIAVRQSAGFKTASDFARALDLAPATYGRYERGETDPNVQLLKNIYQLTGVSLDFLVGGDLALLRTSRQAKVAARTASDIRKKA